MGPTQNYKVGAFVTISIHSTQHDREGSVIHTKAQRNLIMILFRAEGAGLEDLQVFFISRNTSGHCVFGNKDPKEGTDRDGEGREKRKFMQTLGMAWGLV